ncbi:hypothetical protein HG531_001753 [Fusarium graminearum]|nr:hypothetical protein HG531_001753 [Fusarium graminearum]
MPGVWNHFGSNYLGFWNCLLSPHLITESITTGALVREVGIDRATSQAAETVAISTSTLRSIAVLARRRDGSIELDAVVTGTKDAALSTTGVAMAGAARDVTKTDVAGLAVPQETTDDEKEEATKDDGPVAPSSGDGGVGEVLVLLPLLAGAVEEVETGGDHEGGVVRGLGLVEVVRLWQLTEVCPASIKSAVRVGRAERSIIAILVVASRKDTLAVLASGLRVGRLASAGVYLGPAGVGVDGGSEVVGSSVNDGRGTVDGSVRGSVGRGRLLLVIDGDPSGGLVGSLLETGSVGFKIALVTNDSCIGEGHKANGGQDLGSVHCFCFVACSLGDADHFLQNEWRSSFLWDYTRRIADGEQGRQRY